MRGAFSTILHAFFWLFAGVLSIFDILDGRPHEAPERQARDRQRDEWLAAHGWRVLRLTNECVIGSAALLDIMAALRPPPSSDPR